MTPESGPQEEYKEGIFVGYRWFDSKNIEPQFPFGFGLSYTTFEFSDFSAVGLFDNSENLQDQRHDPLRRRVALVSVTVTNTGQRDGAQVVQVYVEPTKTSLPRPPRELKEFAKVNLKKGERSKVAIELDVSAFAYFNPEEHAWVAEPGEYTILVGDSSRHLPLKATFDLPEKVVVKEGQ